MASKSKTEAPLVQAPEPARPDLEAAFSRMLVARAEAERLEKEWKALRDDVVAPQVVEFGEHLKDEVPQDAVMQVGSHKLQWVGTIRPSYDQGRGFLALKDLPDLYREVVVMVPTIDKDRYAVALKEGRVPQEMREAFEVEQTSYCLKYWPIKE